MITKDATVQVRISRYKKHQVEKILKREGVTLSSVINLFFTDMIEQDKVSFRYEPNKLTGDVIEKARKGIDVETFEDKEDLFKSLDL